MATLYLGTPHNRAMDGARSFEEVMQTGIGRAYALSKDEVQALRPGDNVVVVRKGRYPSRAEGKLQRIEFTGQITRKGKGMRRYNVYIDGLTSVEYDSGPDLNRPGTFFDP